MIRIFLALITLLCSLSIQAEEKQYPHLEWTRQANIYEVNIRQYTKEGTITAFEKQLPRLNRMGVKILWIMPVQPIGVKNRKGKLGSYYAIKDYTAVNPESGTQADFNHMVKTAHKLGMKVILDWVANHTAWDNVWVDQHSDWFKKNARGDVTSYEYDNGREIEYWTDVIGLDYRKPALQVAMIDAMRFWVKVADIDGFRCDVASLVPIPFWVRARAELEKEKKLFMLAESNDPAIHVAFDMTYDWKLFDSFADIAQGKADANALRQWAASGQTGFPEDAYRMNFTSNHDVNSWRWSDSELYGTKWRAFAVLAATLPGMPLIYGGQESGLDKKIAFFEKDALVWKNYPNAGFYRNLLAYKARHPALANGSAGGPMELLSAGNDQLFAFRRSSGKDSITIIVNLSDAHQQISSLPEFSGKLLEPWSFIISSN